MSGYISANGLSFAVASTSGVGVSKNMTAITNATEAVGTLEASHGIIVGDLALLTSGWGTINNRIVRAKTVATNDVTWEGLDTSSTTKNPAGAGTGHINEITFDTPLSQIIGFAPSGGDQAYETLSPFDTNGLQIELPTTKAPQKVQLTYGDDVGQLAWWAILKTASDAQTPIAFRWVYASGLRFLMYGYVSLQELSKPSGLGNPQGVISFSAMSQITRYST